MKTFWLFFTLFLNFMWTFYGHRGSVKPSESKTSIIQISWLILQYHKTGYSLSHSIFRPLAIELNVSISYNLGPSRRQWRFDEFKNKVPYFLAGIHIQEGAEMHFRWKKYIQGNKIVHFVRDPYQFLVSSFLYHSQPNPPSGELILTHPFNPCEYSTETLELYYKELQAFDEDADQMRSYINSIIQSCVELYQRAKYLIAANTSESYSKQARYGELLRILSDQSPKHAVDALKLEAYRSIVYKGTGPSLVSGNDLFRMAVNALRAMEAGKSDVMQSQVEDFPYNNEVTWKISMGKMLDFLFESKYPRQLQSLDLYRASTVSVRSHLIEVAYNSCVLNKHTTKDMHDSIEVKKTRFVHITNDLISSELRDTYIDALKSDPVLGVLLATFKRIIFSNVMEQKDIV